MGEDDGDVDGAVAGGGLDGFGGFDACDGEDLAGRFEPDGVVGLVILGPSIERLARALEGLAHIVHGLETGRVQQALAGIDARIQ